MPFSTQINWRKSARAQRARRRPPAHRKAAPSLRTSALWCRRDQPITSAWVVPAVDWRRMQPELPALVARISLALAAPQAEGRSPRQAAPEALAGGVAVWMGALWGEAADWAAASAAAAELADMLVVVA